MYTPSPLQFDPQRITQPLVHIDINNPPFVPNYQCEDYLWQFRPYIAGLLMIEIQGGASRQPPSPLRIYAFNQFAVNNWQNEDFVGLFGKACDYVAMAMYGREFHSPDEAATQLMPRLVTMVVAENTQFFPDLQRYINQEAWHAVQQNLQMWQRTKMALEQYRMRQPVFGYGQQAPRPYAQPQQQGMDPRMMYRQQTTSQLAAAAGGGVAVIPEPGQSSYLDPRLASAAQSSIPSGTENEYTRMMAREQRQQPAQQQYAADPLKQPFSPRTPREEPAMQATQEIEKFQVPVFDDGSILVPEEISTHTWVPTETQPYRPAYHPSTQARFHRVMPDGVVFIEVQEKVNMDFEQHNLPNSIFGKQREGVEYDVLRANEGFARGATEFADRMKWTIQAQQLGDTDEGRLSKERADAEGVSVVIVEDDWLCDVSEVGLMVLTGVSRAQKAADMEKAPDVFRRYGFVSEPIICAEDQTDLLRRLADSRTWLELAGKIEDAAKDHDLGFVEAVSRRSIIALNRVLALNMSIPPDMLQLGADFDVATIQELELALSNDYSTVFVSAYKNHQRNHIQAMFQSIPDADVEKSLREAYVDPTKFPEGKAPWLGLLTSCYSFTTLDMYAHDLDLEIDPDTGSLLTEENSGDVYRVMSDLFGRLPKDRTFAKHLFQTNDGVLLEVVQGDIGQDAYLLSKVASVWIG